MSHTFFWPGKYYFYPIGNTSAVCLTRDIPPEERASILLLGCGDPRHVLYTIFSESELSIRKLDFTCVDFEPAVLGPLTIHAVPVGADQVLNYWKTGTTFSQPKDVSSAKLMNPTFAYSLTGEGCTVHYGTDPMTPFHFAALFGTSKGTVSPKDMVRSAKAEFSDWCSAFQRVVSMSDAANLPCIRFFLADATAACHALNSFRTTGSLAMGAPVAQFRTDLIRLDSEEYVAGCAPSSFHVIETSNLIDHIGLLNILVAAVPLLSPSLSSVLYTESLLFNGEDATKEFAELLYADIGTMALLLNLCPVDYLSGFTTRSNTHEIMVHKFLSKDDDKAHTQFHQVTTWKSPISCDSVLALHEGRPRSPPVFDAGQLGTLLFDVYHAVFEQEDAMTFWRQNQHNLLRAMRSSNMIHYMRESFALFLKLVRERLRVSSDQWCRVMERFINLEGADETMPMNTVNRNDLYAHLHRQNVYTVDYYKKAGGQKIGRFTGWDIIPPLARVILTVPREKIRSFEATLEQTGVGTPLLHGDIRGSWSLNNFSAVHAAYGRVIPIGTKADPRVRFEGDPDGRNGSHDLVVSFVVPSMLLTDIEPPHLLKVRLSVRSTTGTTPLHAKMGMDMEIYSASLMDERQVQVLPERQVPRSDFEAPAGSILSPNTTLSTQIGKQSAVSIELDEQCELITQA
ncbi:hypothetical protein K466DRAFT_668449 [Polyporus arcularius HHB13444]|uniref:DUF4470 domain-containing protein n=1 Tax=Polyporus arcularius HHB13444 TaxID=1314778 RepID=A0A5C3NN43_9APHY|nr:hypothetical protein K466DRAFT_668449 [Polyporus arcularius HHB13444]